MPQLESKFLEFPKDIQWDGISIIFLLPQILGNQEDRGIFEIEFA
jgi:hypothetical protein